MRIGLSIIRRLKPFLAGSYRVIQSPLRLEHRIHQRVAATKWLIRGSLLRVFLGNNGL